MGLYFNILTEKNPLCSQQKIMIHPVFSNILSEVILLKGLLSYWTQKSEQNRNRSNFSTQKQVVENLLVSTSLKSSTHTLTKQNVL